MRWRQKATNREDWTSIIEKVQILRRPQNQSRFLEDHTTKVNENLAIINMYVM
jgi:hypothetical protein